MGGRKNNPYSVVLVLFSWYKPPPSFPTLHYPPVPLHVHNNNINITYCELRRLRVTTQVIMLSGKLARSLCIFTNEQVPFFHNTWKTITISLYVIIKNYCSSTILCCVVFKLLSINHEATWDFKYYYLFTTYDVDDCVVFIYISMNYWVFLNGCLLEYWSVNLRELQLKYTKD